MMLRILWETLIEHIRPIGRGSARRAAALTLALVLGFGLLPLNALAVKINSDQPDGDGETPEAGAKTVAAVDTVQVSGSSIRTSSSDSASVKKNLNWHELKSAAGKVSPGKAVENTYILELSSGTRKGGGTSDNILYFAIHYTGTDGKRYDAIIMPNENAQQAGFEIANQQGSRSERIRTVEKLFGYTPQDLLKKKAMGNVQTDQILFTTPVRMERIDKFQIFGRRTDEACTYSCQGIRIYRVDTLYGLDMYGWFSDWGYIDFAGELVAQVVMEHGAGTFRWDTSGGIYNILPAGGQNGTMGCTLVNTPGKENVGSRHESQAESLVVFRMDFADLGDAGLETLAGSYEAGKEPALGSLAYCEAAALIVRYLDVYDCIREVTLPVAINALGQLAEVEGEKTAIAGYAQQGDTLAFAAMLPDYAAIQSVFIVTGEAEATAQSRLDDIYQLESRTATGNATVGGANTKQGPKLGQTYRMVSALAPSTLQVAVSDSSIVTASVAEDNLQNMWKLYDAGGGYYYICGSTYEDLVFGGSNISGAAVQLANRADLGVQKWKLIDAGDGFYSLTCMVDPTLYLAVQGGSVELGTRLIVERTTNRGDNRYKFRFDEAKDKYPLVSLKEGDYVFINKYWSGSDIKYPAQLMGVDTTNIVNATPATIRTVSENAGYKQGIVDYQNMFHVTSAGDGYYYYIASCANENYVLDAKGPAYKDEATVHFWEKANVNQQKFRIRAVGDGTFLLTSRYFPGSGVMAIKTFAWEEASRQRKLVTSLISKQAARSIAENQPGYFDELCWQIIPASKLVSDRPGAAPGATTAGGTSATVSNEDGQQQEEETDDGPTWQDAGTKVLTAAQQEVRSARIKGSVKDEVHYLSFSVYTDDSAGVCVNSATVQYRFDTDPAQYITSTTVDGIIVKPGERTRLTVQAPAEGKRVTLRPMDRTDKYLITITTDNVENAGTTDNLKIGFTYLDTSGNEIVTPAYDVRDFIKRYYGEWPGNVEEFAYKYGLRDGGTVKLIVPLSGVKEFKAASFRLEGNDEWQFSGLEIAKIRLNGVGVRLAEWKEISAQNGGTPLLSHLLYSRPVDTDPVIFSIGEVYEEEPETEEAGETGKTGEGGGTGENGETGSGRKTRPKPGEEGYKPGRLIQSDGELHDFDGEGTEVSSREEVDWNEARRSMTFATAQKGLGFIKQRAEYTVSVYVAKDKVNALDDDCGSKNLFYFRLLFRDGSSGCTLANQQMVGDAFHTGSVAQFKIYANQDYSDVTAVQVIPDDQDGKGDIYDKLKIERISVVLEGNKALSPTWEARSDNEDGLGWVGIDYREEGVMASTRGAEGRSIAQLATTYEITKKSYSAKLRIGITTGAYETRSKSGELQFSPQLVGGMSISMLHYYDNTNTPREITNVDMVAAMDSYAGRTSGHTRTYTLDGQTHTANADYAVSDPAYHFRAGRTDYFFLTVANITQLVDMKLYIKSDLTTTWNITDVSVELINGTGSRYLNALGEYDYAYPAGQEPVKVTNWTSQVKQEVPLQLYDQSQKIGDRTVDIYFEPNTITLNTESEQWTSVVSREPTTTSDTLNVYIYPSAGVDGAAAPESYDLNCRVLYTERELGHLMQVAANPLTMGIDESGRTVFYAYGLDANNMRGFYGVEVKAISPERIKVPLEYGVMQRVRDGVLIESYRFSGVPNAYADYAQTLAVSPAAASYGTQRLLLQFSEEIERQEIEGGVNDLAVALNFRTSMITGQSLRSKYIYLSDMGVTEIRPGHIYELDYVLGDVADVSSIQIVSIGNLDGRLRGAYLANQSSSGTVVGTWGVGERIEPTAQPKQIELNEEVGLLTLTIKTALSTGAVSSGTAGPVRLKVGYYDSFGYLKTEEFEDIRPFAVGKGSAFSSGSSDTVSLLLPDCSEIRWVDLEPWNDTGDTQAEWKLDQVEAVLGLDGHPITRKIDRVIAEGSPLNVVIADILVTGTATHLVTPKNTMTYEELLEGEKDKTETNETGTNEVRQPDEKKEETTEIYTGESKSMVMASGDGVRIDLRLSGTSQSYVATAYAYDPATGATGTVSLDPTHRYTEAQLAEIIANAEKVIAAGTSEEKKEEAPVESGEAVTVTADSGEKVADSENVKQYIAEEVKAAKNVVLYAKAMQDTKGKLEGTANAITFYAPRNYTGADQYYRLVVASEEAPGVFFTVDITVKSELELLTEAITKLETAQTNTLTVRQTETTKAAVKAAEERAAAAEKTANEAKQQAEMLTGFGG